MSDLTGNPYAARADAFMAETVAQVTTRGEDLLTTQINALLAVAWELRQISDALGATRSDGETATQRFGSEGGRFGERP